MSDNTLKIKEESISNDDFSENLRAAAGIKQIQLQDEAEKKADETNIPITRMIGGHQFFESQRDNGYRSENQALCDLIDNAIEANSTLIDVVVREKTKSDDGPGVAGDVFGFAVCDNGIGMTPKWTSGCIGFGNTSRAKNTTGLGRFGMGLSNASIAFTDRFEVYSKREDQMSHMSWFDFDVIDDDYLQNELNNQTPPAIQKTIKEAGHNWISKYCDWDKYSSGTSVVLLNPDKSRLTIKKVKQFLDALKVHIATTYFKFHNDIEIRVNGEKVRFIDYNFTTPGLYGFDLDEQRAEDYGEKTYPLNDDNGDHVGNISIRAALFPPRFGMVDKSQVNQSNANANIRWKVIREQRGIVISRNKRRLYCEGLPPGMRFQNNDIYFNIEIDFDGALDDFFKVTTHKNSVTLQQKVWDILKNKCDLNALFSELRKIANQELRKVRSETIKTAEGDEIKKSESALAVSNTETHLRPTDDVIQHLEQIDKKSLDEAALKANKETGVDIEAYKKREQIKTLSKPFEFGEFDHETSSAFIFKRDKGKVHVLINKSHKLYDAIFANSNASPEVVEAVEILIGSLYQARTRLNPGHGLLDDSQFMALLDVWSKQMTYAYEALEGVQINLNEIVGED